MAINKNVREDLADLVQVAEERLRDFRDLWAAKRYTGAIYMGRYVVEIYLKCLICKRLRKSKLPTIFHLHDLDVLLFYTGNEDELRNRRKARYSSFEQIKGLGVDDLRYQSPAKVLDSDCQSWDLWLNDPRKGLVPWFRSKIR